MTVRRLMELDGPHGQANAWATLKRVILGEEQRASRAVFVLAEGGAGKTMLLNTLTSAIRDAWDAQRARPQHADDQQADQAATSEATSAMTPTTPALGRPVICAFVDLQSPDVQVREGVLEVITNGLRQFVGDAPFADFDQALHKLSLAKRDPAAHDQIPGRWEIVKAVFKSCLRELTRKYTVVLLFDTMEEFERQIPVDGSDDAIRYDPTHPLTRIKAFLEKFLLALDGIVFVLAGRSQEWEIEAGQKRLTPYAWHQQAAGDDRGLRLINTARVNVHLDLLTGKDVDRVLQRLMQRGREFDEGGGKPAKIPSGLLKALLTNQLGDQRGIKPIYLALLAELYRSRHTFSRDLLRSPELSAEAWERELVKQYFELSGSRVLMLYMALGPYRFDVPMIAAVTGYGMSDSQAIFHTLAGLSVVKRHEGDPPWLTLQDEFRRMLHDYVWKDMYPDASQRDAYERQIMRKILHRYMADQDELQLQTAQLIAQLQELHTRYAVYTQDADLVDYARQAGQLVVKWRRCEVRESNLVSLMEQILEEIRQRSHSGDEQAEHFIDGVEVFERKWHLLQTTIDIDRQPQDMPEAHEGRPFAPPVSDQERQQRVLERELRANRQRAFEWRSQQPDAPIHRVEDYWRVPNLSQVDLTHALFRIRRRELLFLQRAPSHPHTVEEAIKPWQALVLEGYTDGNDQRSNERQLEIWIQQADIFSEEPNDVAEASVSGLVIAERNLSYALGLCEEHAPHLDHYRSSIHRRLGSLCYKQRRMDAAVRHLDDSLRWFSQTRLIDSPSVEPRERWIRLAMILEKYSEANRFQDLQSSLLYCQAAYDLYVQARRRSSSLNCLRTLTALYRLAGDYERAIDQAEKAVKIASVLEYPSVPNLGGWGSENAIDSVLSMFQVAINRFYRGQTVRDDHAHADQTLREAFDKLRALQAWDQDTRPATAHARAYTQHVEEAYARFIWAELRLSLGLHPDERPRHANRHQIPDTPASAYAQAIQRVDEGLAIVERRLGSDPHLIIVGLHHRLQIKQRGLPPHQFTYDHLLHSDEFARALLLFKQWTHLKLGSSVNIGRIRLLAGEVAQRTARATQDYSLYDEAIRHYLDAFWMAANQPGYWAVVAPTLVKRLEAQFHELTKEPESPAVLPTDTPTGYEPQPHAGQQALQRQLAVLEGWCNRLQAAIDPDHLAREVQTRLGQQALSDFRTKLRAQVEYLDGKYQAALQKAGDDFSALYDFEQTFDEWQDQVLAMPLVSGELPDADVQREVGRISRMMAPLEHLGLVFRARLAVMRRHALAHAQSRSSSTQLRAVPDDIGELIGRFRTALSEAFDLSEAGDHPQALEQVMRDILGHPALPQLGVHLKLALVERLRAVGDISVATDLALAALREVVDLGDRTHIGEIIHHLGILLALRGDYLSAHLYTNCAEDIGERHQEQKRQALIKRGIVLRTQAGYAAVRGAPGPVTTLYDEAIGAFEDALQLSDSSRLPVLDRVRLERDIALTHSYRAEYQVEQLSLLMGEIDGPQHDQSHDRRRNTLTDDIEDSLKRAKTRLEAAERHLNLRTSRLDRDDIPPLQAELKNAFGHVSLLKQEVLPTPSRHDHRESQAPDSQRAPSQAQSYFEASYKIEAGSLNFRLDSLIRWLELEFLGTSVERANREHLARRYEDRTEPPYESLLRHATYQQFEAMIESLRERFSLVQRWVHIPKLKITLGDMTGPYLPDGVSIALARAALLLGTLAQFSMDYEAAIRHYARAGDIIARCEYAGFKIKPLLEVLTRRFYEVEDVALRERWAEQLEATWQHNEVIANSYPEMLTFCSIQRHLIDLTQTPHPAYARVGTV